jgi:hypothetical protein
MRQDQERSSSGEAESVNAAERQQIVVDRAHEFFAYGSAAHLIIVLSSGCRFQKAWRTSGQDSVASASSFHTTCETTDPHP